MKLRAAIGDHPRWRDEVLARLQGCEDGNYDLTYWTKRALATITGGPMPP